MNDDVTVAILAGGKSRRMGSDKSFVTLHGRPLIEHVVERVRALSLPVLVIANNLDAYQYLNMPAFSDLLPEKGSLGGLYTALARSETAYTVCVACDMPFLNPALLTYLLTLRDNFEAVVPRIDGRLQGLHTVYHKACLPYIFCAVQQDRLRISDFLKEIQVRFVEEPELRRFDPELHSFTNINTQSDLLQSEAKVQIAGRN